MNLSTISILLIFPLLANVNANVVSLTSENYDTLTAGKAVFIKFFAPWCGHCKSMAPDYEKVASTSSSPDIIIAEVDCTNDINNSLCSSHGIQSFPTLKYGNPSSLSDYDGGRDYASMKDFVQTIKVPCSLLNLEKCSKEEKMSIEEIKKMSDEEIAKEIQAVESILAKEDERLQGLTMKLQEKFEGMMKDHEERMNEMKVKGDYDLKKAILAMKMKN
mmetsp:Transcript_9932/g.12586  ORF Transcript_9932/g.12586 Transcript_9932/m.12586 type:complete len:218 (+) Transcript_9932:43-696(+)